jgi:hypothetical protein
VAIFKDYPIYPKQVEVINFSVPGYNTAIESELIKQKVIHYNPDLIIIGFVGNDLDLPDFIRRKVSAKSYLWHTIYHLIKLFQKTYLDSRNNQNEVGDPFADNILQNIPYNEEFGQFLYVEGEVPEEYQYMVGKEYFLEKMKLISDNTIRNDIPVILSLENSGIISELIPILEDMGFMIHHTGTELYRYLKKTTFLLKK